MLRLSLLAGVVALICALAADAGAVIGGRQIDIQETPWQVYVKSGSGACGGAIIDAGHVVTAAHCLFDSAGNPVALGAVSIRAGISDFKTPHPGDQEQDRGVASYRIHPGFQYSSPASPDDVAVLALTSPLSLGGSTARAIALPAAGTTFAGGETLGYSGFGRESAGSPPDGTLNALSGTVDDPAHCGGSNGAVLLCVRSPNATPCSGDSGSAFFFPATPAVIAAITSGGQPDCPVGAPGTHTNVTAGEILTFVQGNNSPPTAPRSSALRLSGTPQVGQAETCTPSGWSGDPSFAFAFVDAQSRQVLQTGASGSYVFAPGDVGRTVDCRVSGTNAGGTAVMEAGPTGPVQAAPPPPTVTPTTTEIAAADATLRRVKSVSARRGQKARLLITLHVSSAVRGTIKICATPPKRTAVRACRRVAARGVAANLRVALSLRIKRNAPVRRTKVQITARLPDGQITRTVAAVRVKR